jgi:hypothetical protein
MGAGAVGDVSEDLGPVLELDPVHTVGKRLHHDPLHERGALGHERRVYQSLRPLPAVRCAEGHLPQELGKTLSPARLVSAPVGPFR